MIVIHLKNVLIPTATFQAKMPIKTGKFTKIVDTAKARDVKSWWWAALHPHRPEEPITGPVRITVCLGWPAPPSSFSKKFRAEFPGGAYKITKPDLGNVTKALYDTLESLGFVYNDSQFVEEHLAKQVVWGPGYVYILLEQLEIGIGDYNGVLP